MVEIILAYLGVSALGFYAFYSNAVDFNFRLPPSELGPNESIWKFFIEDQKGVLGLLKLDFLQIHCPWDKATSIRFRVQEAREMLEYHEHEKGWTVADCDNPANHAQIAKDCFVSRTRFWAKNIFEFLTGPIRLALILVILLVGMPLVIFIVQPILNAIEKMRHAKHCGICVKS